MTRDEKPADQNSQWPPQSYSSLSELLGNHDGLAIYRRFATLNAQNLLYLQSELINLEDELKRPVIADSISDDERRRVFKHDVSALKNAPSDAAGSRQWRKVLEIREELKEYNDALLQQSQLYQLPKANKHDLRVLREWYHDPDFGGMFLPLPETNAWNEDDDLVALSKRKTDRDVFTSWFTESVVPRIHKLLGHRIKSRNENTLLFDYRDSRFNDVTHTISIILSSLLPPASIFASYYVHRTPIRLGLIMVFSVVFTACLAIFTSAKRVEIFAAKVALASVQVVFIGTNSPGSNAP